mgnify:CR=1 FL=1
MDAIPIRWLKYCRYGVKLQSINQSIPIRNKKAIIAQTLLVHVISIFGVPMQIHSDQGQTLESNVFKELCKILRVYNTRTTP